MIEMIVVMPDPIPFQCAPIASEIEGLEQEKAAAVKTSFME